MKRAGIKNNLDLSQEEFELSHLMRSSQDGDAENYHLLLVRIRAMLTKYVENSFVRLGLSSGGGQEDVLQNILLAVHLKRHTYDPAQFFLPWLYAIARYKVIDHLRKNKKALRANVSLNSLDLELGPALLMPQEIQSDLDAESICEGLPEKQKIVLRLVKLEGLSVKEAAQRTGFSQSDIKVTVHRAMRSLQEKIKMKKQNEETKREDS